MYFFIFKLQDTKTENSFSELYDPFEAPVLEGSEDELPLNASKRKLSTENNSSSAKKRCLPGFTAL